MPESDAGSRCGGREAEGKTPSSHFGSGGAPLAERAGRAMKVGLPQAGLP